MGCLLTVSLEDGRVTGVSGNTCKRGEKYGVQEVTQPTRMVTAVIPAVGGGMPVSVKTAQPIPKARIAECMRALSRVSVRLPVSIGDVVLQNVCGTGVDVIATRSVALPEEGEASA